MLKVELEPTWYLYQQIWVCCVCQSYHIRMKHRIFRFRLWILLLPLYDVMVHQVGIGPTTCSLKGGCSANWATDAFTNLLLYAKYPKIIPPPQDNYLLHGRFGIADNFPLEYTAAVSQLFGQGGKYICALRCMSGLEFDVAEVCVASWARRLLREWYFMYIVFKKVAPLIGLLILDSGCTRFLGIIKNIAIWK